MVPGGCISSSLYVHSRFVRVSRLCHSLCVSVPMCSSDIYLGFIHLLSPHISHRVFPMHSPSVSFPVCSPSISILYPRCVFQTTLLVCFLRYVLPWYIYPVHPSFIPSYIPQCDPHASPERFLPCVFPQYISRYIRLISPYIYPCVSHRFPVRFLRYVLLRYIPRYIHLIFPLIFQRVFSMHFTCVSFSVCSDTHIPRAFTSGISILSLFPKLKTLYYLVLR